MAANPFAELLSSSSLQQTEPTFVEVNLPTRNQVQSSEYDGEDVPGPSYDDKFSERKRRRPHRRIAMQEDPKADRTVFVGNVPVDVTKKKLKSLFSDCGKVESVRFRSVVSRRAANSRRPLMQEASRFNAYVVFQDPTSVEDAVKKNGVMLEGQKLRVDSVGERESKVEYPSNRSVFIGNVPHEVRDDDVYETFADCGEVEGVRLVRDRITGLCKGFGFVLFKDSSSVLLATKYKGLKLQGRKLRVFPSKAKGSIHKRDRLRQDSNHKGKWTRKSVQRRPDVKARRKATNRRQK